MKVTLIELPHDHPDGPGVRVRLSGEGWSEDMTVEDARALLHALADAAMDAARTDGFIDG